MVEKRHGPMEKQRASMEKQPRSMEKQPRSMEKQRGSMYEARAMDKRRGAMDKPMDCGVTGCAAHRFIHRPEAAAMNWNCRGPLIHSPPI